VITSRRNFLVGSLATLFAAPAIVRCGSLMPVKAMPDLLPPQLSFEEIMARAYALTRKAIEENLYMRRPGTRMVRMFTLGSPLGHAVLYHTGRIYRA
jgi:hypothetical protein